MLSTLYNVAIDWPVHEAMQALAAVWLLRLTVLFGFFMGNCPCCGASCANCSGTLPTQFQADITGIANGGGCTDCASDWNTTFLLDHNPGEGDCRWSSTPMSTCSGTFTASRLVMDVGQRSGHSASHLDFSIEGAAASSLTYQKTKTYPIDCTTISETYTSADFESGLINCDESAISAVLTAIP